MGGREEGRSEPRYTEDICEPRVCCEHVVVSRASPRSTRGAVSKPSNHLRPIEPLGIAACSQTTFEADIGEHDYIRAVAESKGTVRPSPTSIKYVELVLPLPVPHLSASRWRRRCPSEARRFFVARVLQRHDFCSAKMKAKKCSVPPLRKRSTHGLKCDKVLSQ